MAGCCDRLRNSNMDTRLRMTLVCLYILTLIFTLMTCLSLGWSVRIMTRCPLYANMRLLLGKENQTITLQGDTVWGDNMKCNFCVFGAVCGSILAIMWFWFYLLLSNFRMEDMHGVRVPPDTRLLLPSMVVNVPMAVVALVVACMISDGRSYLCAQVRRSLGEDCNLAGQREWLYPVDGQHGFNYIRVAQYGSWLWFISIMATIIVGAFRVRRFLLDGGQHGSYSIASSSMSSLTSSDDFYSTSDSDIEEEKLGFYNPNYEQASEVAKAYPGSPGQRLPRVEEEEADRGTRLPSHGGPPGGRLPSPGDRPVGRLPSPEGPPGRTLPSPGDRPVGRLPSPEGPPGGRLPSPEGPPGGRLPSPEGPPGGRLPSPEGPPGGRLPSPEGPPVTRLPPLDTGRQEGGEEGAVGAADAQLVKKDKSERHKSKKATT